jgi:hypothetical protein
MNAIVRVTKADLRHSTHVPDRSILQPGEEAEGAKRYCKYASRPRNWGLTTFDWYALSGSGSGDHKPETSVVEQRSYQPSCRHAIYKASVPEDAVQRSGKRSTVMVILTGAIGSRS